MCVCIYMRMCIIIIIIIIIIIVCMIISFTMITICLVSCIISSCADHGSVPRLTGRGSYCWWAASRWWRGAREEERVKHGPARDSRCARRLALWALIADGWGFVLRVVWKVMIRDPHACCNGFRKGPLVQDPIPGLPADEPIAGYVLVWSFRYPHDSAFRYRCRFLRSPTPSLVPYVCIYIYIYIYIYRSVSVGLVPPPKDLEPEPCAIHIICIYIYICIYTYVFLVDVLYYNIILCVK